MASFPDTSFEQLPLAAKRRIDAACARFEQAWRTGRPNLEAFFGDSSIAEFPVLLTELLLLDVEYRRRAGETPRASEYLCRFPGHEAIIRAVLPPTSKSDTGGQDSGLTARAILVPTRRPAQVPGYELLEELGRGGMGVVYKARHLALNRLVALKFILAGNNAPARYTERFQREAEVVARLRHPNIVQIYDIGQVEQQTFLVLEYAEGGSLRERLDGQPMEPRAAAMLLEPVARAVQHAHRHGIVHRDLKPANILLAVGGDSVASGNAPLPDIRATAAEPPRWPDCLPPISICTPKLTDFGLARMLDMQPNQTEQGMAAGTPQYMSPEQACGDPDAGPLVDVWALGVTLYELLTGRPPFRAATARETMRLIVETDPVPPTQLQPSVPRDLETICLKCLEKEPARRYPGARELAADLRRFLDGEAILARREGRLERLRRWARRRPYRALAGLTVVAVLLGGLAGLTGAVMHAFRARTVAERGAKDSQQRADQANLDSLREQELRKTAEDARRQAQLEAAALLLQQAQIQGRLGSPDRAVHDLLTGLRLGTNSSPLDRLFRANLVGWLNYVHRVEQVVELAELPPWVVVGSDRRIYTVGTDSLIRRRDSNGQLIPPAWKQSEAIRFLAISRDSKHLLIGEPYRVVVRELPSGREIGQSARHPRLVTDVLVAADGESYFTACEDGIVRRWHFDGERIPGDLEHPLPPRRLALSPEGTTLAVALASSEGGPGNVWLWWLGSETTRTHALPHSAGVWAVAFHPEGQRLFTGAADGLAREWLLTSSQTLGRPFDHGGQIVHLDVTPDGRRLLTVSREESARLWEVPTRQPLGLFSGANPCTRLSPDGSQLIEVLANEVRFHSLARPRSRLASLVTPERTSRNNVLAILPIIERNKLIYAWPTQGDASVTLWTADLSRPESVPVPWPGEPRILTHLASSVDKRFLAQVVREQNRFLVELWQTDEPKRLHAWPVETAGVSLAVASDGSEVALGEERGQVLRWSSRGQPLPPLQIEAKTITALAYHPAGEWLAVGTRQADEGRGEVQLWRLGSHPQRSDTIAHPLPVESLAFSGDGKLLLIGGRTVRLWQLEPLTPLSVEVPRATVARFVSGEELLVGTSDGTVQRFSSSGQSLGPAVSHPGAVLAIDRSLDGRTLLVAGREGTARLWDLEGVPRPLGPPIVANQAIGTAAFLVDGRSFFTLTTDGDLRHWPLISEIKESTEELQTRTLAATGREVNQAGLLVPLAAPHWRILHARSEPFPILSAIEWHEAQSRDARQEGDLFGERWHLDRLVTLAPENVSARLRRAVVLARLGAVELARADLQQAGDDSRYRRWAHAWCEALDVTAAAAFSK